MKLLVLAQTPPPLHGQSQMVRTLVDGLPAHGLPLHHVNLRLSRDHADIGRWRPGKLLAVLAAAGRAVAARWRHGCDTLYCVPAPGKRGALYRDWLLLALCRPFFPRLVLHLHNGGLADWLTTHATAPERWLTRRGWPTETARQWLSVPIRQLPQPRSAGEAQGSLPSRLNRSKPHGQ